MQDVGKSDVLIIHGLEDRIVPYSWAVEAITTAYADSASELLLITGEKSIHGFKMMYEEGKAYALRAGVDFLNAHQLEAEEE